MPELSCSVLFRLDRSEVSHSVSHRIIEAPTLRHSQNEEGHTIESPESARRKGGETRRRSRGEHRETGGARLRRLESEREGAREREREKRREHALRE